MAYIFKKNLVSSSKYSVKCPYAISKPKYIVVHNTANDASAVNEVKYMISNNNQVSYHIAVDNVNVVQGLPLNRNAWASGDGANGQGNRYGIHVEICYSKSGGVRYTEAEENAVYVCAKLLNLYNLPISALKQHADFSNKNCPHRIRNEGRWNSFVDRVEKVLNTIKAGKCSSVLSDGSTSSVTPKPTPTTTTSFKIKVVNCDYLNARKGPGVNHPVVESVKVGTILTIVGESGNWYKTKSGLWISKSYTQVTSTTNTSFKIKVVNCNYLNARKGPGTSFAVVESVKVGTILTIVGESGNWYKTKSGLYVSKSYCQKI